MMDILATHTMETLTSVIAHGPMVATVVVKEAEAISASTVGWASSLAKKSGAVALLAEIFQTYHEVTGV